MKEGPDIALIGSLIGDPARANMLIALMSGKALTATELSKEAGVTLQTASTHLSKLESGGLIALSKQGRHKYFSLADHDVADLLENMMGLAASRGHLRTRTGPKDPALRKARVCYNHLAGDLGVHMYQQLLAGEVIAEQRESVSLTKKGEAFLEDFGVDITALKKSRRIFCKPCLDWSERQSHLAGSLGEAILNRFLSLKWAKREPDSRIIRFTRAGEQKFLQLLEL